MKLKLTDILPSAELLQQIGGIESGLRQRKRVGTIGLLVFGTQTIVGLANSDWWQTLTDRGWIDFWERLIVLDFDAASVVFVTGAAAFAFILNWKRFWLKESQAPFRYTCSIEDFQRIGDGTTGTKADKALSWLSNDLKEKLNQRLEKRLYFEHDEAGGPPSSAVVEDSKETRRPPDSLIHICGHYGNRQKPNGVWCIEVIPRVRVGSPSQPETLAHRVIFDLKGEKGNPTQNGAPANSGTAELEGPPALTRAAYDQLVERVYFSIATEIYREIQFDVRQKIALLPSRYFRAVALLYEAEDYARSNTIDAYEVAMKLFRESFELFHLCLTPRPNTGWRRAMHSMLSWLASIMLSLRRTASRVWLPAGHAEILCARAEIGYADMLLYRRSLAGISGRRLNPIFEAKPVAERAVERLGALPREVEGCRESLFDAYVTLALAWSLLGSSRRGNEHLKNAHTIDPLRAEQDSRYLFVAGELELNNRSKLNLFRRATELEPRFEVALFSFAVRFEMLWRSRPTLETNVANLVFNAYEEVLKINPGNIGSWANLGYMHWLLKTPEHLEKAIEAYEYGREYKDIKRETFVAELDYGRARIAAESGMFTEAYEYYLNAVSAHLGQGIYFAPGGYSSYLFRYENEELRDRYRRYLNAVKADVNLWQGENGVARSLREVIADLNNPDGEQIRRAARGLGHLVKSAAGRMNQLERAELKRLILRYLTAKSGDGTSGAADVCKDWPSGDGDLLALGNRLERYCCQDPDEPLCEPAVPLSGEITGILQDPTFIRIVERYVPTQRIMNSVRAFALAEYGAALYNYYLRSGDDDSLRAARSAFEEASKANRDYIIPHYNLGELDLRESRAAPGEWKRGTLLRSAEESLMKVHRLEPNWPEGLFALTDLELTLAEAEQSLAEHKAMEAKARQSEAENFQDLAMEREFVQASDLAVPLLSKAEYVPGEQSNPWIDILTRGPAPISGARIFNPEAQKFRELADKLNRESAALANEVEDIRKKAKEARDRALGNLKRLVAHEWIIAGLPEKTDIVNPRPLGEGLRRLLALKNCNWDRDIDDLQAEALTRFGRLLDWKKARSDDLHIAVEWLLHIRNHFRPGDFALHGELLDLLKMESLEIDEILARPSLLARGTSIREHLSTLRMKIEAQRAHVRIGKLEQECREALCDVIRGWLSEDPSAWWALSWANNGDLLTIEEVRGIFGEALEVDRRPGSYYKWVMRWLEDSALKLQHKGEIRESLETYRMTMVRDSKLVERYRPDEYYRWKIASLHWAQKEYREAFAQLGEIRRETIHFQPFLLEVLAYVSVDNYMLLGEWLQRECERSRNHGERYAVRDANEASLLLVGSKHQEMARGTPPDALPPTSTNVVSGATPILLDFDAALLPTFENLPETHPLRCEYIPGMLTRIMESMGVDLPEPVIRPVRGGVSTNSYVILINEIPRALNNVEPAMKFCPDFQVSQSSSSLGAGSVPALNPLTGRNDGAWLPPGCWAKGMHLWDQFEYMAYHLETVLRDNLASFVGIGEVEDLMNRWRDADRDSIARRTALIDRAMADAGARLRLMQVLQLLVKEGVPITRLEAILEECESRDRHEGDVTIVVEAVRRRVADQLPGNDRQYHFLGLSESFEKTIKEGIMLQSGRFFLVLTPEDAQGMLAALRIPLGSADQRRIALVTRMEDVFDGTTIGIRPFVRRLTEIEFPQVKVLSVNEIREELRRSIAETVEFG
jgi:hypothetical protein